MREFAVWDNNGKTGKKDARYTVLKSGRVFVAWSDGYWEYTGLIEREVDKTWMDKYQPRVEFSDLPVEIQNAVEKMAYP